MLPTLQYLKLSSCMVVHTKWKLTRVFYLALFTINATSLNLHVGPFWFFFSLFTLMHHSCFCPCFLPVFPIVSLSRASGLSWLHSVCLPAVHYHKQQEGSSGSRTALLLKLSGWMWALTSAWRTWALSFISTGNANFTQSLCVFSGVR